MARTWLISSRGIARKIKSASCLSDSQLAEIGAEASRECPNCKHTIDNSDVSTEWPGLPAGVKFDPSDSELIGHLAGKSGQENRKFHFLIDEFIQTLEGDLGIYYTHPENLPGVKKDGRSVHFFHRISNAYSTGSRKRRKTCGGFGTKDAIRWHKTGKSKLLVENGVEIGWKKIMVLYKASSRGYKPVKANWVMHQYHLGSEEVERDGELVVSKIFYNKQADKACSGHSPKELDGLINTSSPRTPKTIARRSARQKSISPDDDDFYENDTHSIQTKKPVSPENNERGIRAWSSFKSPAFEESESRIRIDEFLMCNEVLDSFIPFEDSFLHLIHGTSNNNTINPSSYEVGEKELLNSSPADLSDLQFCSQESITSWLDRL